MSGGSMRTHQYLRAHPEAERVLDFIRSYPEGVTSVQVAEAFPELGRFDRASITRNLFEWGFITKARRKNKLNIWVAT